jgi:hypothetical protein
MKCSISYRLQAARTSPCNIRIDNAPRVRVSATLGEVPEMESAMV